MNGNSRAKRVAKGHGLSLGLEALEPRRLLTRLFDIDADGDFDGVYQSAWFENFDGKGNFITRRFTESRGITSMAGDMDGDGDLDIVTTEPRWYENTNGKGSFSIGHEFPAEAIPGTSLRLMDFSADGDIDVVAFSGSSATLYENSDGRGTLLKKNTATVPSLSDAGDIDGDGDLDAISLETSDRGNKVSLHQNRGDDTFEVRVIVDDFDPIAGRREGFTLDADLLDMDNDRDLDVVILYRSLFSDNVSVSWRSNSDGRGTLLDPLYVLSWNVVDHFNFAGIIDVNQDGALDAIGWDRFFNGSVRWRLNNGGGKFETNGGFQLAIDSFTLSDGGDINGDGAIDVITTGFANGAPQWIDNASGQYHLNVVPALGALRAGDANKDYYFDQADLIEVGKAGKYGRGAKWEEGDWNGAPGGTPNAPPAGNGIFDVSDLDRAFAEGIYLKDRYDPDGKVRQTELAAFRQGIKATDIVFTYDPTTGGLSYSTNGFRLTSLQLTSTSGLFSNVRPAWITGSFDIASPNGLFHFDPEGFDRIELGPALPKGVDWDILARDLKVDGSRVGGGGLGNVRLTCLGCEVDIDTLQRAVRGNRQAWQFDHNRDAIVDHRDVEFLVRETLKSSMGDSNLDGLFNSADFVHVFTLNEYEDGLPTNSTWADGDWNSDGEFDSSDLVYVFQLGGYEFGLPSEPLEFGPVSFVSHDFLTSDESLSSIVDTDLDGDGDLDLLISDYVPQKVAWYENKGLGVFGKQRVISTDARGVSDAQAADVDGDGDLDVVSGATGYQFGKGLFWFENTDGRGSFGERKFIADAAVLSLSVADLDGDGDADVLTGSFEFNPTGEVVWYKNVDGRGSFTKQRELLAEGIRSVHTVDMDGDGDLDALLQSRAKVAWYENLDGLGQFGGVRVITTEPWTTSEVGDMDGDRDLDVLVASYDNRSIAWFENTDGRGLFSTKKLIATGIFYAASLDASDLDHDGDLDLLTGGDNTKWYENTNGSGQFERSHTIDETHGGFAIASDLDRDGSTDVVTSWIGLSWFPNASGTGQFSGRRVISASATGVNSLIAADLDGDIDTDLLSGSHRGTIAWYEDHAVDMKLGPQRIIDQTDFSLVFNTADVDGDGDVDVLSASSFENTITWYENENGEGFFGSKRFIDSKANGVTEVTAGDIDGDGDVDVISTFGGTIVWHENRDGRGNFSAPQTIANRATALALAVADVDGDQDLDVVASIPGPFGPVPNAEIVWFENKDSRGTFSDKRVITADVSSPEIIHVADIDHDGDVDVLSNGRTGNSITWYSNADGKGNFGVPIVITTLVASLTSLFATDLDGDGDLDLLSSSSADSKIAWYENTDGDATFGAQQVIGKQVNGSLSVIAADLDRDGDLDVLSASTGNDAIEWFENRSIVKRDG